MLKVAVLDDWQDVARRYGDWGRVQERAQVKFFADALISEDAAAEALADFEILLTMQDRMKLPGSLIARLPKLQMIGITKSNTVLDKAACAQRGIVVSHTDGPKTPGEWAPAELAFGLIISAFRSIPAADAVIRAGGFQHGVQVGRTLCGNTLGIVGLGRLGSRVAGYAKAFGMDVLAWSPDLDEERAAKVGARLASLDDLLAGSDVVSIHVTLSEQSRGLIGAEQISRMKEGALLVNTSRGPIVDQAALIEAVETKRIAAALDVFDDEPLPADHRLRSLPGTVLTPHLGYGVDEAWKRFYPQSVENVLAFLDGSPLRVVELAPA